MKQPTLKPYLKLRCADLIHRDCRETALRLKGTPIERLSSHVSAFWMEYKKAAKENNPIDYSSLIRIKDAAHHCLDCYDDLAPDDVMLFYNIIQNANHLIRD